MINFTSYETFKDEPIPHKYFTFHIGQPSYEIIGGSASPLHLVSDVVPKPLVSEGLRGSSKEIQQFLYHFSAPGCMSRTMRIEIRGEPKRSMLEINKASFDLKFNDLLTFVLYQVTKIFISVYFTALELLKYDPTFAAGLAVPNCEPESNSRRTSDLGKH